MKRIMYGGLFCLALFVFALQHLSAQTYWGNNPSFSPTYTTGKVGVGFTGYGMQRNIHIYHNDIPGIGAPIESYTPGIRFDSDMSEFGTTNVWDVFAHQQEAFEIRNLHDEGDITAFLLFDDYRGGLWQNAPKTMLHIGSYRQLTFGHTGGNNNGLYGEYIGFNTYLEQHTNAPNTITKLAGGGPGGGGQTGGAVVATDFSGNFEIQTLNTSEETGEVSDITYDPQFIFTNKGVLEFTRSTEQWTANHWDTYIKAPISTAWMTSEHTGEQNGNYYLGIGMTTTGWYFIRSHNAPGGTNGELDNCGVYPFYVSVNGKATAREVEVQVNGWCDYVFEEDYDLMPLESLESFVKHNRHLPDIPAEAEVLADGINLGEMNARLLKKVEELTLYTIELNKRVKELERERNK